MDHDKGRHLYNIQPEVNIGRTESRSRREESIITRLRIGHTGLNSSLKIIGKHPTGKCQHCRDSFRNCRAYFISLHKVQSRKKPAFSVSQNGQSE